MANNNNFFKLIMVVAVVWFLSTSMGGTPPADNQTPPAGNTPPPASSDACALQSSFTLQATDKFDSTLAVPSNHRYKINDGPSQTYAGSAISVPKGTKVSVLWGNATGTAYRDIREYTVEQCGANSPFVFSEIVQNVSVTMDCQDENGDVIVSGSNNYTMGTGNTMTSKCRIKLDSNKKGFPHGAVLVAELTSKTVYKEQDTAITGSIIEASTAVPAFYSVTAGNAAYAYDIKPIMDTNFYEFVVYAAAEDAQNPAYTSDIVLTLYSKDCYENSDTGKFACGIVTEDNDLAGDQLGTTTLQVD